MAASAKPVEGNIFALQISTDDGTSYDTVKNLTSINVAPQTGEREITSFDSCSFDEFLPTKTNLQISFETLVNHATTADKLNTADLIALQLANTVFLWKVTAINCSDGSEITGEYEWAGSGFITGLPTDYPDKDNATVSGSIRVTGSPTYTVIS
jgi:hypothetical protein